MSPSRLFDAVHLDHSRPGFGGSTHFTAIDFETTGLQPGHVIEVAAVRIGGDGSTLAEMSTLVNPGRGIDPGATWIHHITREQLDTAPPMGDVLGHLLELCRDSVLVAHNLPFEEKFLAHELRRHGVRVQRIPGLCTLATARRVLQLPNYKLGTVVQMLGLDAVATHAALDDARACARLTATLITEHGMALTAKPRFTQLPQLRTAGRLAPRASALRAGDRGWMASLMDRLPVMSLYPTDPALEAAYIDLLTEALADGKITGVEAKALATQARTAGMSAADVRRVHTSVLTGLREVAEADGIITTAEERDLRKTANALGVPEILTDLVVTATAQEPTGKRLNTQPTASAPRVLVLGTSAAATELRTWAVSRGARLAKNLTTSVTHLVVDASESTIEANQTRINRAAELGIAVIEHAELRKQLGEKPSLVRSALTPVSSVDHAAAQQPETAPAAYPQAHMRQSIPAQTTSRSIVRLWLRRSLVGLGALLVIIGLLAALGGATPASVLITLLLGAGVGFGGYRISTKS